MAIRYVQLKIAERKTDHEYKAACKAK